MTSARRTTSRTRTRSAAVWANRQIELIGALEEVCPAGGMCDQREGFGSLIVRFLGAGLRATDDQGSVAGRWGEDAVVAGQVLASGWNLRREPANEGDGFEKDMRLPRRRRASAAKGDLARREQPHLVGREWRPAGVPKRHRVPALCAATTASQPHGRTHLREGEVDSDTRSSASACTGWHKS